MSRRRRRRGAGEEGRRSSSRRTRTSLRWQAGATEEIQLELDGASYQPAALTGRLNYFLLFEIYNLECPHNCLNLVKLFFYKQKS